MISIFGAFKLIMHLYHVIINIRQLSGSGVILTDRLCTMYHMAITKCVQVCESFRLDMGRVVIKDILVNKANCNWLSENDT